MHFFGKNLFCLFFFTSLNPDNTLDIKAKNKALFFFNI